MSKGTKARTVLCAAALVGGWVSGHLVLAAAPATAPVTQPDTQPAGPEVVKLTLHPSATTQPALQYKLLPDLFDQMPGNAAPLYAVAGDLLPTAPPSGPQGDFERIDDPGALPLDQLAHDKETASILKKCAQGLQYVDLAARREDVDWGPGFQQFGFDQDHSSLRRMWVYGVILSLRGRYQLARGDLPAALHTMQTSFSMARQINQGRPLYDAMAGKGIAAGALYYLVQEWVGLDHSPNLYWALSDLPHPFLDYKNVPRVQQGMLYSQFPALREAAEGKELPAEQWRQVIRELIRIDEVDMQFKPPPNDLDKRLNDIVTRAVPKAREYLLATKMLEARVQAMPPEQAVGIYFFHEYQVASDEVWKAWELPYLQSIELLHQADDRARQGEKDNPFLAVVAYTWTAKREAGWTDRYIALLRTVEALRNHLARHGQLPERLDQISDVPLPLDPFTDKPFSYRTDGHLGTLEALAPPGRWPGSGWRIEMTVAE